MPELLISLLERRHLNNFRSEWFKFAGHSTINESVLIRPVLSMNRPPEGENGYAAMTAALSACHSLSQTGGHAVVMVLQGLGQSHSLYYGSKRLGATTSSSEDFNHQQEGALRAFASGLSLGPVQKFDLKESPELTGFIYSAPAMAVITGIPSCGTNGLILNCIDRIAESVGTDRYAVVVVGEPMDQFAVDTAIDACLGLKSEIHSFVRRTEARGVGGGDSESSRISEESSASWMDNVPGYLSKTAGFFQVLGVVPGGRLFSAAGSALISGANAIRGSVSQASVELSKSKNWSDSTSQELLNAHAEACETTLQRHIERIRRGRALGWWRSSVYVIAENEGVLQKVVGTLRSIYIGDKSELDPFRVLSLPAHLIRPAILRASPLLLTPFGDTGHPLGADFDSLSTCVDSSEFALVAQLPHRELPGIPMRKHAEYAVSIPEPAPESVEIGTVLDGQMRGIGTFSLRPLELNRHLFITGSTGYGKTNASMHILIETYRKLGIPFLVIEPAKSEYRRLASVECLSNTLNVFGIGEGSLVQLRLNPFQLLPGAPITRHIDLLKAVFNAAFSMGGGMHQILEQAIIEIYTDRGWSLHTSTNRFLNSRPKPEEVAALTPCLEDLHRKIDDVLKKKAYGRETNQDLGAALRSRIEGLMLGAKGFTLNTQRSTPISLLFEQPAVVELENFGDGEEQSFVMALLFVMLAQHAKVRAKIGPERLRHITLIEEAHRLLSGSGGPQHPEVGDSRRKAISMFTDALAEMRGLGEGFIIAEQIPGDLAPQTLKNTNTKLVFNLNSIEDRRLVGASLNLNESQIHHIANLKEGHAVAHDPRIGDAIHIEIPLLKDTLVAPLTMPPQMRLAKACNRVNAGCNKCPSPCDFRHLVLEVPSDEERSRLLNAWFEQILIGDVETAWNYWVRWRGSNPGRDYCEASQWAYKQSQHVLAERRAGAGRSLGFDGRDTILVEQLAHEFGLLVSVWIDTKSLTEDAKSQWDLAISKIRASLAETPPIELWACKACSRRCVFQPFVRNQSISIGNSPKSKLTSGGPVESRYSEIQNEACKHLGPSYGLSSELGERDKAGWLYCLLAHQGSPENHGETWRAPWIALIEYARSRAEI